MKNRVQAVTVACRSRRHASRRPRTMAPPIRVLAGSLAWLALAAPAGAATFGQLSLDQADAWFIGEGLNEQTGWSVAFAGDVNGDGFDDFLLGAQLNDPDSQSGNDAGKAYLLFGQPARFSGEFDLLQADGRFAGEQSEDYAGSSLAPAGDVDADGFDDFLIGAWANDDAAGDAGKTYLIYGSASAPGDVELAGVSSAFIGEHSGDASGYTLAALGDINADGFDDFAIGAPNQDTVANNAGRIYVLFGREQRFTGPVSLSNADVIIDGDAANDFFGHAIAGGFDMDLDGYADIAVGAYGNNLNGENAGAAYVFSGAVLAAGGRFSAATDSSRVIMGAAPGDQFAFSLVLSPDVDGDGICDLFAGANRASLGASWNGAGILVPGTVPLTALPETTSGLFQVAGDSDNDKVGYAVDATGDMDGDGLGDLLLAAPYADIDGQQGVGKVGVIFGQSSLADRALSEGDDVFLGTRDAGLAGFSIAGGGDVDGDQHTDILIGAAGIGRVYLILTGRYFDDDGDGRTEADGDCDDADPDANPDSTEIPYDGIDQDCDGTDLTDVDGDGYPATTAGGEDCDDNDPAISPAATELPDHIDQNCNGVVDEGTPIGDADNDGYTPADGDCNDEDSAIHPGQLESANGIDDDCDGAIDEDLPGTDDDGDGLTDEQGDCNDDDPTIYPGAQETIDGIDQNCNGRIDEQPQVQDLDGDGFSPAQGDPDDTDPTVYPGATELPDGKDNDGDGTVDEGAFDLDGDGFSPAQGDPDDTDPTVYPGATPVPTTGDADGDGFSLQQGDCDDQDPAIHPGATEVENGTDDNCDGRTDEQTDAYDDDGDGYSELEGDTDDNDPSIHPAASGGSGSTQPGDTPEPGTLDADGDGFTTESGDCNDGDPETYPGANETIDGMDNDCDQITDNHTAVFDDDQDGFSEVDGDCDDDDPAAAPDRPETCNTRDDDCDGLVDEGCPGGDNGDDDSSGSPASPTPVADGVTPTPFPPEDTTPAEQWFTPPTTDASDTGRRLFRGLDCSCDSSSSRGPAGPHPGMLLIVVPILRMLSARRKRLGERGPTPPGGSRSPASSTL